MKGRVVDRTRHGCGDMSVGSASGCCETEIESDRSRLDELDSDVEMRRVGERRRCCRSQWWSLVEKRLSFPFVEATISLPVERLLHSLPFMIWLGGLRGTLIALRSRSSGKGEHEGRGTRTKRGREGGIRTPADSTDQADRAVKAIAQRAPPKPNRTLSSSIQVACALKGTTPTLKSTEASPMSLQQSETERCRVPWFCELSSSALFGISATGFFRGGGPAGAASLSHATVDPH